MKLGFTGTASGMTRAQKAAFYHKVLRRSGLIIAEFHHGDCVGSDAESHAMVRSENPGIHITGHPPRNPNKRAWCKCDELRPELPYLVRNHNIVDETDEVVATPSGFEEVLRSGTWATMRYTKKIDKTLRIIWPDGTIGFKW